MTRIIAYDVQHRDPAARPASACPSSAETYDGWLNDINGFHVKPEHVFAALDAAASGPVAEGCVGGGTGMNCHEFKGGIGTSSRVLRRGRTAAGRSASWSRRTTAARSLLRIDGVPVGQEIPSDEVPTPTAEAARDGSIIIIVATDAPLLPNQCKRFAQRATIGLARVGGNGDNGSGDLFLAFSTGNRGMDSRDAYAPVDRPHVCNRRDQPLFEAVADATEEAIVNALCMATTTPASKAAPRTPFRSIVSRPR